MTTTSDAVAESKLGSFNLDARSLRIVAVAGSSYLGRAGAAIAVLITIPMARQHLPPELFGVWMMLGSMLAFFSFADLGVGNGVLNRIIAAHAARDGAQQRRVMRAGYVCTGTAGAIVLVSWALWLAAAETPTVVVGTVRDAHRGEVLLALHLFVALVAVNIPAGMVQKVQLGLQQGQWIGVAQLVASVATLVAVPSVLALGGGLPALVAASLGTQVLTNLASAWLWRRRMSASHVATPATAAEPRVEWPMVVSLLRTGSLFLLLQLAVAIAFQSDAIVITQRLGQEAYGDFAIVQRLFLAASSILLSGLAGLWPAIGEALAGGDKSWIRKTLTRSYLFVALAIGSTSVILALLAPQIINVWVGSNVAPATALLAVLAAWTLVEALGTVSGAFLNAAGVLGKQLICALMMAALAFALKWLFVDALGTWGTVLATLIAYSIISVPMQVYLIRRLLRETETVHAAR
jgi:O-antigen/teichoic acid export membrane protein